MNAGGPTPSADAAVFEPLEPRLLLASSVIDALDPGADVAAYAQADSAATISGAKWYDSNRDGLRDGGESPLPGWRIYADLNANGRYDVGEPFDVTDTSGQYSLQVALGSFDLAEELYGDWVQTYPQELGAPAAGTEFRVNNETDDRQAAPSVAANNLGDFVVAWYSGGQDGSASGVFARLYHADGAAAGYEFQVNTYTAGYQQSPAVAMDDSGRFVIVWTSNLQDGNGYGVYAQRYAADGSRAGGEFRVNTYVTGDQWLPSVGVADNGDFVIAWESYGGQDGDGRGVYARRYWADGSPKAGEFRVNTRTAGHQGSPSVAVSGGGEFVIAWASDGQDGSSSGIYAQLYHAGGTVSGGEFRVNTYVTDWQGSPTAAMADDGRFVIAWESVGQDSSNKGVYAQLYQAGGAVSGGEFRVNTTTYDYQECPAAAMGQRGDFVIAWQSIGQDGSKAGTYAQRYGPDGAPNGGELPVNVFTAGNQGDPAAAMDDSGRFVIAWTSEGQDGSNDGVYARQFATCGVHHLTVADGQSLGDVNFGNWRPVIPQPVVGRYVLYNRSYFDGGDPAANTADDNALAIDKRPLLPGRCARFVNYTSYSRGINGIVIDIAPLGDWSAITAADFEFRAGNNDTPSGWSLAPTPTVTVRPGGGAGGADRVTLIWADNAIQKKWLQVTIKANVRTGLSTPDVFYYGNAIGDCGDDQHHASVDSGDRLGARANPRGAFNRAPIDFAYDYNRDSLVDSGDRLIARANATSAFTELRLIYAPPATVPPSGESPATTPSALPEPAAAPVAAEAQPADHLALAAAIAPIGELPPTSSAEAEPVSETHSATVVPAALPAPAGDTDILGVLSIAKPLAPILPALA